VPVGAAKRVPRPGSEDTRSSPFARRTERGATRSSAAGTSGAPGAAGRSPFRSSAQRRRRRCDCCSVTDGAIRQRRRRAAASRPHRQSEMLQSDARRLSRRLEAALRRTVAPSHLSRAELSRVAECRSAGTRQAPDRAPVTSASRSRAEARCNRRRHRSRWRAQHGAHLIRRHGPAEKEALTVRAAEILQPFELLAVLDPLGDHVEA
jgi:hypothetical protein